jgi:hypothetical protein
VFVAGQFRDGGDLALLDLNPFSDKVICARTLARAVDTSNDGRFGQAGFAGYIC